MVRYRYLTDFSPPAPFVHVVIGNPENGQATQEIPALLDVGADRTVVPLKIIEQLHFSPLRTLLVGGLGNEVQRLETFSATVQIRQGRPYAVEILGHANESYLLLGRDVLNQLRIVLDGPNQVLEID